MANGPVPRTLTRAQQARRQRVIDAAMSLALEGGYEAVQMRDVAARADVAMGTVYRYFTSKDHLLAASLVHWVEQLDSRLAQSPAQGDSPAERVIDALDRALRSMGRQPTLVGAVFTALASPDPAAIECQQQVSILMERISSLGPVAGMEACGTPHIHISFGVALYPADGTDPESLLERADQLMYEAKKANKLARAAALAHGADLSRLHAATTQATATEPELIAAN